MTTTMTGPAKQQHKRPAVRRRLPQPPKAVEESNNDPDVESMRVQLSSLTTTAPSSTVHVDLPAVPVATSSPSTTSTAPVPVGPTVVESSSYESRVMRSNPSGILKTKEASRYQKRVSATTTTMHSSKPACVKDLVVERDPNLYRVNKPPSQKQPQNNSSAVEGYAPITNSRTDPTQDRKRTVQMSVTSKSVAPSSEPKNVMRSLSDLLAHAESGVQEQRNDAPSKTKTQKDKPETTTEMDLNFACMSPAEYQQTLALANSLDVVGKNAGDSNLPKHLNEGDGDEEEAPDQEMNSDGDGDRATQEDDLFEEAEAEAIVPEEADFDSMQGTDPNLEDIFFGRRDVFFAGDDNNSNDDGCMLDDDNDNDSLMVSDNDAMEWSDNDAMESSMPPPEPRAFLKLWKALSTWITPQAVELVQYYQQQQASSNEDMVVMPVDTSDLGASRCAGLMAILRMHMSKCLAELNLSEKQRQVEGRLGQLLTCFDYAQPMTTFELDMRLWQALTCIFIQALFPYTSNKKLPPSIASVGITVDEHQYLTQSALQSLAKGSH
eukprot:scaffold18711_cov52-Attheya_sp.AAC.1